MAMIFNRIHRRGTFLWGTDFGPALDPPDAMGFSMGAAWFCLDLASRPFTLRVAGIEYDA